MNNTVSDKLLWLEENSKKAIDILLVKSLIESGIEKSYKHLIYQQDATSSGLQIINILMKDTELAKRTKPHDIYEEILNIFMTKMKEQTKTYRNFEKLFITIQRLNQILKHY